MPILVDYSQIVKSAVSALANEDDTFQSVEPGMIRHTFLNSLRAIRMKLKDQFGEIVICVDSGDLWRKDTFPYYKARRKIRYKESKVDWAQAMPVINAVAEELRDEFPYKFVKVERAEADDIIGTICHTYGVKEELFGETPEQFVIVSSDKDFLQLQTYTNVRQWNNVMGEFVSVDDAEKFLYEKILTGDSGDDIPNVRSADDFFVVGEGRQKPITAKIKENFEAYAETDPDSLVRFKRNELMIDLSKVPDEIKSKIIEEYEKPGNPIRRSRILTYMSKHRLRDLLEKVNDF